MHIFNSAAKHSNEGANELQKMQNKGHKDCLLKKEKRKKDWWRRGIWNVLGFWFSFFYIKLQTTSKCESRMFFFFFFFPFF